MTGCFPESKPTETGFQVSCPHLAAATSLPPTYRLLSVFSGIPLDPFQALTRAGLMAVGDDGLLGYPVSAHITLAQLRDRGLIRWVAWSKPGTEQPAYPPGYVLTGYGEVQLTEYFNLYGPALTGRGPG